MSDKFDNAIELMRKAWEDRLGEPLADWIAAPQPEPDAKLKDEKLDELLKSFR